jgi:molybdate transport system substrate-binding protein
MRRLLVLLAMACLASASAAAPVASVRSSSPVEVFAAASLKEAMDDVSAVWRKRTGAVVRVTYASSAQLAKQIDQGAPADLFVSADTEWMDWAAKRNRIDPATRRDIAANSLVLVAPKESRLGPIRLDKNAPLARLVGSGRIAVGETASVPAGIYAKRSLESLGLWPQVKDHLAQGENVRAALAFVARGETPLGIVYATDAQAEPRVKVIATFPETSHPPIVYPAAVVSASKAKTDAQRLLTFLAEPEGQAILRRRGFRPVHR